MLTLNQINKAVQAKYPRVMVCRGEGYFYLWSEDEALQLKIAGLYDNNIGVCKVNHLSLEQWVASVKYIIEEDRNQPFQK